MPHKVSANESLPVIQPSSGLRDLIRKYFEQSDKSVGEPKLPPSAGFNDLILNAMRAEGIPFHSQDQARWIARWLASGEPVTRGKRQAIMFARIPEHRHVSEYDPIQDGVGELTSMPFLDGDDERRNAARRIPVMVTIEPLRANSDGSFGYES